MKIGIVTIYKCYNYGSFYQAYGLMKYLQDEGHDVEFIRLDTPYNKKYRLRRELTRDIKRDWFSLKLIASYAKDWKRYRISNDNQKDYDCIIIGSDEIWNIHNKSFTCLPEYYGLNFHCQKIFSYASCVGRAELADFAEHQDLLAGIKQLSAVSARDEVTEDFLSQLLETTNIPRVIDPSFLVDWSKIEQPCKMHHFILVYTYDGYWGFSEEYINAAKEFAASVNLPLVSVGFRNTWCDQYIACSPSEFLGYLKNASYVITDTFHGSAMSIQYKKQFVCMGVGKAKTESLLEEFGLQQRMFSPDSSIAELMRQEMDYDTVEATIQEKLQSSRQYLSDHLNSL